MGNKQPPELDFSKPTVEINQNPIENMNIHIHRTPLVTAIQVQDVFVSPRKAVV